MRLFPFLLLVACSEEPDRPGRVTPGEQQGLNDAADMLDPNSVSAEALRNDTPEDAR